MGGLGKKLRPADPVSLLATTWRAVERIPPDRLKRDAANRTSTRLHPVMAPAVPQVATLAKAAGVYAELSAVDATALAMAVMAISFVAILATAASVDGLLSALDANRLASALTVAHVAI